MQKMPDNNSLKGAWISNRKSIRVKPCRAMLFSSGRKWPKAIAGKFIVREHFAIGIVHADDRYGKWVFSTDSIADSIQPLIECNKMERKPLTKELEAEILGKRKRPRKVTKK